MDTAAVTGTAPTNPEEALDQLLRQIIGGFFVLTDGQGALSKWSEPAELMFGLEAEDALMEPFFGTLADASNLSVEADAWRSFLETGEVPGARGRLALDAKQPGGGTFPLEAVFIPVKLDEGFDFSLFLEDLSFELPLEMMLMRMRQQHPVVIRALRGALADEQQPWDGVRTAGTLVAFRALAETPWMEEAMQRREEERAIAEEELQSRIQAYEAPEVQGTDVYDLEDARAVIDRLKWATERIEELEERSRILEDAAHLAADARVRAEAAERAALEAKAELAGAIADRPVDSSGEAERLEVMARLERVERAATEASQVAAHQRKAVEVERGRQAELDQLRSELLARLEKIEATDAERRVALEEARARVEAVEKGGVTDELVARLDELERLRAEELAEAGQLRAELDVLRGSDESAAALAALRAELDDLRGTVSEHALLRAELDALSERAESASGVMRRGAEREQAAAREAEAARAELQAALKRIEQVSEETAKLKAHLEVEPEEAGLSDDDRRRLEAALREAEEARTGLEAMRAQSDELRTQGAELREEAGRLQARLAELADGDGQARHDLEGLRREHEELRGFLDEVRSERDEARAEVREALRVAEDAKVAAERASAGRKSESGSQISPSELEALHRADDEARARLEELHDRAEAADARAEEAREESLAAREAAAHLRDEAREAQRLAREASERVDMVDRGAANVLGELKTQSAVIEEVAALSRSAQQDAAESRADAGEARAVVARLEKVVSAAREQMETALGEAAGAREQAAAASETASSVRDLAAGVGDAAREAAGELTTPLAEALSALTEDVERLRAAGGDATALNTEVLEAVEALKGESVDLAALRAEMETLREAGGDAAAVSALGARLDAVEAAVPEGIDARMDSLREGLAGALGRLESVTVELAAARSESGAGRQNLEQRLADSSAELMAARTDAEQARRGLDGLREELTGLREYAAAARTEAAAAKEAAASARRASAEDERRLDVLATEVKAAVAAMNEFKHGFEEARQAAVAARRDADAARMAAERVGAVNEATTEKFTEVWQQMLTAPPRSGVGVPVAGSGLAGAPKPPGAGIARRKEAPPERPPREGFDDQPRPMAVLDLKGKFTELNPGFTKLVGYKEHEFAKATWPSVLDRQVYKDQKAELDEMVAGERETAVVQSTYMHGQGIMVLVNGSVWLQRDENGNPDHLLLVAEPAGSTS